MMGFPAGFLELAFKRSRLRQASLVGGAKLLSAVSGVFGGCRVNFDAEGPGERPSQEEVEELCASGHAFSETYQAGRPDGSYLGFLAGCYLRAGGFGINFVLGNARYGCAPRLGWLEQALRWFSSSCGCRPDRVKVGVEGERFGLKILRVCGRLGLAAYVLNTPWMGRLVEAAKTMGLRTVVYTPIRVSVGRLSALEELLETMGYDYFARRGIRREKVGSLSSGYAVFGSPEQVAERLAEWRKMGVDSVAFSPVFRDAEDLLSQLRLIKEACLLL